MDIRTLFNLLYISYVHGYIHPYNELRRTSSLSRRVAMHDFCYPTDWLYKKNFRSPKFIKLYHIHKIMHTLKSHALYMVGFSVSLTRKG